MAEYNHRSKEDLHELYIKKDYTQEEVAERCGVTVGTISDWINRFGIETGYDTKDYKDVIEENYDENLPFTEMADGTNLSSDQFRHKSVKYGYHTPDKDREYTEEELLEKLRDISEDNTLSMSDLEERDGGPYTEVYQRRFGSWNNAVEKAGLDKNPSKHEIRWSKDELLSAFKKVDGNKCKTFIESEYGPNTTTPILERFGSFKQMLWDSNVDPKEYPSYAVKEDTAIDLLSEKYDTVHKNQIKRDSDLPGIRYYVSHFGSIEDACIRAEVEYQNESRPEYSKKDIINGLNSISSGGTIQWSDIKNLPFSPTTVVKKSDKDTIKEAVEKFGFEYETNNYTDEELIDEMKRCQQKHGDVKVGIFKQDETLPSHMTYIYRFGSWSNAKEIAGVKPESERPAEYDEYNGHTYLYGPSFYKKRDDIRERDGYKCQNCGVEEDSLSRELDVHHITPVRTFDRVEDAHTEENLISLCHGCHMHIEENNIDCPEPPQP